MDTSDSRDLAAMIEKAIVAPQVRLDPTTRFLYSIDASNYQIVLIGVTFPEHVDDVVAIHDLGQVLPLRSTLHRANINHGGFVSSKSCPLLARPSAARIGNKLVLWRLRIME